MIEELKSCNICPRKCKVNRIENKKGNCNCIGDIEISLVSTHYYEEPCISGKNGSGTIFFTHCNMHCKYCQNYKISQEQKVGKKVSIQELSKIILEQQKNNVNNINLVTPTMYAYQIKKAIIEAKKGIEGLGKLEIPVVYNTSGYENVETLKALEGLIDIYLPDFKYYNDELAMKYSGAPKYFENVTKAILEMQRQIKKTEFDENGIMKKGMIIRHLVLPNHLQNSKNILRWIKDNIKEDTYISLMAQYFPTYLAKEDNLINRKLTKKEYKQIEEFFYTLDFKNGYIQELGEHEEEYVPDFNAGKDIKL